MLAREDVEEIEAYARPLVNGGFRARDEVIEDGVEYFEDQYAEEDLTAVVDRLWRERLAEQSSWPAQTQAEHVLAALTALSAKGIVGRANFTCCNTCGAAEIGDEAADGDRGYVFFHQQDTESAAAGGGLYLSYGTLGATDPTTIANEVVDALTAVGVPTVWNGQVNTRILVSPLEWQVHLE